MSEMQINQFVLISSAESKMVNLVTMCLAVSN